jgi:hypothetical protein
MTKVALILCAISIATVMYYVISAKNRLGNIWSILFHKLFWSPCVYPRLKTIFVLLPVAEEGNFEVAIVNVVEGQAGRPDWANIGPLGDCLPWVNSF